MSGFTGFTLNITIIQGDFIDRSQTSTNMDSFNNRTTTVLDSFNRDYTTTTHTSNSSARESSLELTPDALFDDLSSHFASNTMSHQQSDGISQIVSEARRTSSSMTVDHLYPPSRLFTQDLRAAHPKSNCSTDSSEVLESLGANRIRNSPTAQKKKLCQRIFNKLKGWFNRFFNYL